MVETHPSIGTFDEFLAASIERLRDSDEPRTAVLAFLLAVPEAWGLAWDEATKDGYGRVAVAGTLSVVTATALMKLVASGPLAFLVTGVSTGALLASLRTEGARIVERSRTMSSVVERFRIEFAELASERRRRTMRESQWSVMMDGMLARFATELGAAAGDPASVAGFSEHVASGSMPPSGPSFAGSR